MAFYNSVKSDVKAMERKRFAEAAKLLNFGVGIIVTVLQKSGLEEKINDELIRGVNASVRAAALCPE